MEISLTVINSKFRAWNNFSVFQRYLIIQALILLPLVNLSLNILGYKRTYFLITKLFFLSPSSYTIKPGLMISRQIITTTNMVTIAAKYYKSATCLRKSLTLWFLLRCQGIETELQIGTRFKEGEFQAHAWVEYQGYVVGEPQGVKQSFVAFENLNTSVFSDSLLVKSQISSYQPEIELLLYCASTSLESDKLERIKNLLQQDIDWKYLLKQACQHGVFLIFYQNLVKYCPEYIPANIQVQLQAYSQIKTARNMFISKKLCQLIEIFKNNNIQVIPFKGSVLAASAYGNLNMREFCDIDLIIKQEDFLKIQDILATQGYQPRSELQPWGQDFTNQDDSIHIDIHWQLAPACFPYQVDFQQLWQNCETINIFNYQFKNLSPEDLLLILCLQIVKDAHYRQEKLKQIYDIAQVIRNSSLNWQLLLQKAESLESERILLFGLAITSHILQVSLPLEVSQKIIKDQVITQYLNHISKQLFCFDQKHDRVFGIFKQGFVSGLYGLMLRTLILIKPGNLLHKHNRYLMGHLMAYIIKPNSRDLKYASLPSFLSFGYYLIRPIRLINKFFIRDKRGNVISEE